MQVTGQRDEFGVHSLAYYQDAYRHFSTAMTVFTNARLWQMACSINGVHERSRGRGIFMVHQSDEERNRARNSYLLQWGGNEMGARLVDAKLTTGTGCAGADLENFTRRSDGLWGVYRFKRGFGGMLMRSIGAWDRVYGELYRLYRLYRQKWGQIAHN